MADDKPEASGGGKPGGSRTKTPAITPSTRLQRNIAEKERRDKLNGFISELATLVPMVSCASKPLDKVSILRLAAAEMRLHFSCLNPKKYKKKPLALPPEIMSSLDLIEKTTGGFVIATTLTGLIVFCSRSIEDYLGYQNIDVMGNKVTKYIYEDDIKYFESKVNSVISSLKKSNKKKSRVIKAHMLQRPMPRSNEASRPRNMIFKISVLQNDASENGGANGSSTQSPGAIKTGSTKDFGYSAVVLLFVEPVRLEPEIDITYIDINQDVYFTRHGLQGEITYADQSISTITGYMPHDVQGTSAYQYICSSDVPIALFAQKAMFSSPDGKGFIVYRLRIRDMRFIYLQSSGQIAYKEGTNEISHFVCCNKLLSEEEGSQELKKFQQRYAPQIMAAKMLQVKQNPGSQSPVTDLAYEQVMSLMNHVVTSDIADPGATIASPDAIDQNHDKNFVTAACSLTPPNSVHSSEKHSSPSPISTHELKPVSLDYSGYSNEEQLNIILKKPEQREGGGPLRRNDCVALPTSPYETGASIKKEKSLGLHNGISKLSKTMLADKLCRPENVNTSGSYKIQQNNQGICEEVQTKLMHSVNVLNSLQSTTVFQGSTEEHQMSLDVNGAVLQNNVHFILNASSPHISVAYAQQNNDLLLDLNQQQDQYTRYTEDTLTGNQQFVTLQNVQMPETITASANALSDQPQVLNEDSKSKLLQVRELLSPSQLCDISSVCNMLKSSSSDLSPVSNLRGVDYYHNINPYHENGSPSNKYLSSRASGYKNGASTSSYNGFDILSSKSLSEDAYEGNNLHHTLLSVRGPSSVSAMETFDLDTSLENTGHSQIHEMNGGKLDFTDNNFLAAVNTKPALDGSQNVNSDDYSTDIDPDLAAPADWTGIFTEPTERVNLSLNKELYNELDLFFQTLPQTSRSPVSSTMGSGSELPPNNGIYSENSTPSSSNTKKRLSPIE